MNTSKIKIVRIFRQIKAFVYLYLRFRIDIQNAFFHYVYFIFSDTASRRNNLTVDVGEADLIIVYQHKWPTPLLASASTV